MFSVSLGFRLFGNEASSMYKINFLCGVIDKSPKAQHFKLHDTFCVSEIHASPYFAESNILFC